MHLDGTYYIYQRHPRKCPQCGKKEIAQYFYGMPASPIKWFEEQENKLYEVGGCCKEYIQATSGKLIFKNWVCRNCGLEIYK